MTEFQDELIFKADFNNIDETGELVKTSLYNGFSRRIPHLNERILLRDSEGNRCWGWVRAFKGVMVSVELDVDTWVSGDETLDVTPVSTSHGWSTTFV